MKWQTAGIIFTQRLKISIFAPQGRLVAPILVKFGMAEGHAGPLGYVKFHANLCRELECGPQIQKFPLFGKESPFDGFLQVLGAFMRPTTLH